MFMKTKTVEKNLKKGRKKNSFNTYIYLEQNNNSNNNTYIILKTCHNEPVKATQ